MAGCKVAAGAAGIPSISGICWRKCRCCLGLILVRHGPTLLERARAAAAAVTDPELPPLTVDDLGILRDVRLDNGTVEVAITPTYSGCPAMREIADAIEKAVRERAWQRFGCNTSDPGLDDGFADRCRAGELAGAGHCAARSWQGTDRCLRAPRSAVLAAVDEYRTYQRFWVNGVQGAAPLFGLQGALRSV